MYLDWRAIICKYTRCKAGRGSGDSSANNREQQPPRAPESQARACKGQAYGVCGTGRSARRGLSAGMNGVWGFFARAGLAGGRACYKPVAQLSVGMTERCRGRVLLFSRGFCHCSYSMERSMETTRQTDGHTSSATVHPIYGGGGGGVAAAVAPSSVGMVRRELQKKKTTTGELFRTSPSPSPSPTRASGM